ncbi:MAG: hypothetical protein NTY08_17385 [Proteobacteria bacterium]|nr:hypothetical protein [Pseudomonadota bacterium]
MRNSIALVMALFWLGCKPTPAENQTPTSGSKQPSGSTPDKKSGSNAQGSSSSAAASTLKGSIRDAKFVFGRGWAYVSPTNPDQISIGLYGKPSPGSCDVYNGEVFKSTVKGKSVSVQFDIPRKADIGRLPYKNKSIQVSFRHEDEDGSGGGDVSTSAAIEITALDKSQIAGSITAKDSNSEVSGTFVAEICTDSEL